MPKTVEAEKRRASDQRRVTTIGYRIERLRSGRRTVALFVEDYDRAIEREQDKLSQIQKGLDDISQI